MTQILALLTQKYCILASDRRLTFFKKGSKPTIATDNSCKLVSLCGINGIAYSGLATIDGLPTHEWIGIRLAEHNPGNSNAAAKVLADLAGPAVRALRLPQKWKELNFIIAGWTLLPDKQLFPQFLLISNMYSPDKKRLSTPAESFQYFERILKRDELYAARILGQSLPKNRANNLDRLLRKIIRRNLSANLVTIILSKEIVNTSIDNGMVGDKVLICSIPKLAAEKDLVGRKIVLMAKQSDDFNSTFCYFDPEYSELIQYGPTFICGGIAYTDIVTVNNPDKHYQSSSLRILHLPKKLTQGRVAGIS